MVRLDILEQESVTRKWVKLRVTNMAEQGFLALHVCPLPCLGDVSVERLIRVALFRERVLDKEIKGFWCLYDLPGNSFMNLGVPGW